MTKLTPDYSRYFWQGASIRLRPWRLEDAELRYMASLDSPTLALHQDGIVLPSSVELQRAWLEKAAGLNDDGMLRFALDNLDGATVGWVTLHSHNQKNGTFACTRSWAFSKKAESGATVSPTANTRMKCCLG